MSCAERRRHERSDRAFPALDRPRMVGATNGKARGMDTANGGKRHDSTRMVTAFFAKRPMADRAKAAVIEATGITPEMVKIMDGTGTVTGETPSETPKGDGVLKSIWNGFSGAQNQQPGFVLTAHVPDAAYAEAQRILGEKGHVAAN